MNYAVELIDLTFRYPDGTEALKGVNLQIEPGERVAIIGSNGSGKTTLLHHLNGLLVPSGGEVRINGEKITKKNLDEVRMKVGLVFQDPDDQLFAPTVEDDIAFGPRNMGLSRQEVEERVARTLEILNITNLRDKSPDNLSGGQKRLVSIAGVLAMEPEIIALDEPTSNLDPRSASSLMHLLFDLNRDMNITLIIATHDVDSVPQYASRVCVMHEGGIVMQGTPEEVFTNTGVIRESNLRPPRMALLMESLHEEGLPVCNPYPLTIKAARVEILKLVGKKVKEHNRSCM